MAWASLLLLLITYCSGIASQPTLTQVPFQSVTLGNTVRLTTTLSSGHANYVVSWYQQREGQAPRLVLDTSNNRGSGIPERFSGSRSGNIMSLTITGALAEDEAVYYCVVWTGSE
ncbi:immunoglobulin iota chain [Anolis sagrei]|uniref:immunoglobulin iota chain n=1 Tax=Anolis sagrei TaxID=38937 RepID=UPI003520F291